MNNQDTHKTAVRRAEEKFGFVIHLMIYLIVNLMLSALNFLTNPEFLWFIYPLFGWGIALLIHGAVLFAERNLKERFIESELNSINEKKV